MLFFCASRTGRSQAGETTKGVGGEGKRKQEGEERRGKERGICKMEELKEGAREELFFALLMCSKQTLLAFLFLCFCHSFSLLSLLRSLFLTISLKCPLLRVIVW